MDFAVLNENKDLSVKLEALRHELQTVKATLADSQNRLAPIPKSIAKFFNRTQRVTSLLKALWQD